MKLQGNQMTFEITGKLQRTLSAENWYHATTFSNYKNILATGVKADYNIGSELDFGYGFYLTTTENLAESYIARLQTWNNDSDVADMPVIMEYKINPLEIFNDANFNSMMFPKFDCDFAEFVFKNRINCNTKKQQHSYDIIYGVMSDSKPTKLLLSYRVGDITKDEVIAELQKDNRMKQLSLHNQGLCDKLILSRAYLFNPETEERKELNIHE